MNTRTITSILLPAAVTAALGYEFGAAHVTESTVHPTPRKNDGVSRNDLRQAAIGGAVGAVVFSPIGLVSAASAEGHAIGSMRNQIGFAMGLAALAGAALSAAYVIGNAQTD